jgi:nucleoside-diphosphate-sugar epimerase
MNILVTGGSGFLGRHIIKHYSGKHNILSPTSSALDLSHPDQLQEFLQYNKTDVVIHTAIRGGKRGDTEDLESFVTNLKMYENIKSNSDRFKKVINFCSGAAFDRNLGVQRAREQEIIDAFPRDYYGLAKNLIAKDIKNNNGKFINLRLFGCFGLYENNNRFIKNNLVRSLNGLPIEIHQNKHMDFFWVMDLLRVLDYVLLEDFEKPFDCNMCYGKKHSLVDIGNMIKYLTNNPHNIILNQEGLAKSYIGSSQKIDGLSLKLKGLEYGIKAMYDELKRV